MQGKREREDYFKPQCSVFAKEIIIIMKSSTKQQEKMLVDYVSSTYEGLQSINGEKRKNMIKNWTVDLSRHS